MASLGQLRGMASDSHSFWQDTRPMPTSTIGQARRRWCQALLATCVVLPIYLALVAHPLTRDDVGFLATYDCTVDERKFEALLPAAKRTQMLPILQYAGRNYLFSTWVRMTAPNNGTGLFYIDVSAPPYIYADGLLEFVARDAELHDFMRFAIVVADVNGHYDELLNLLCAVSAFTVKDVGGNGLHLTLANFAPINTTIDGSVEWDAETMDPVAESLCDSFSIFEAQYAAPAAQLMTRHLPRDRAAMLRTDSVPECVDSIRAMLDGMSKARACIDYTYNSMLHDDFTRLAINLNAAVGAAEQIAELGSKSCGYTTWFNTAAFAVNFLLKTIVVTLGAGVVIAPAEVESSCRRSLGLRPRRRAAGKKDDPSKVGLALLAATNARTASGARAATASPVDARAAPAARAEPAARATPAVPAAPAAPSATSPSPAELTDTLRASQRRHSTDDGSA